jgi:hypothetical protein
LAQVADRGNLKDRNFCHSTVDVIAHRTILKLTDQSKICLQGQKAKILKDKDSWRKQLIGHLFLKLVQAEEKF